MKLFIKIIISSLLLFNGIGALYGGWNLIHYPDGSSLQMPISYLKYSPFTNYFIPGIILFVTNGLLSIAIFTLLITDFKNSSWWVIVQGAILTGWILIQIVMLQTLNTLQLTMLTTGILLLIGGWKLKRIYLKENKNSF